MQSIPVHGPEWVPDQVACKACSYGGGGRCIVALRAEEER